MPYILLLFCLSLLNVSAYRYQCLSHEPHVGIYHDLLSPAEAQHLIDLAQPRMNPSSVVDLDGAGSTYTDARTSFSAFLQKSEDPIVKAIEDRIAGILACETTQIEPLQVVRYQFGQEYKAHHDYFSEEQLEGQGNNQRKHTFLVYLNSFPLEAGGYTAFPKLSVACIPSLGAALYFANMNEEGQVQVKTLHAGTPIVIPGLEKWACNIWVRESPWQSSTPQGQSSDKHEPASSYPLPATIPHL